MARRELLHISKAESFKEWLARRGWTLQAPKGDYEVIRAIKPGKDTLIIWTRLDAKEHYSIPDKWVSLVYEFIREKEDKDV